MTLRHFLLAGGLLLGLAQDALARDVFILATGRRDPRMDAIHLKEALKTNAIVSRSKVALDRLDGKPLIDLKTRTVVATVTGVGNDPYSLAIVEHGDD
jgi:hypothetical protein